MNKLSITDELITGLVDLGRRAGAAIMDIYCDQSSNSLEHYDIQKKADLSPLTAADLAAHRLIAETLPQLLPLPILSEEGQLPDYAERRTWETYWLVDPLDGTKEFIAGNGEFTVNIALIHRGRPCLGVVHAPVTDTTYLGILDSPMVQLSRWQTGARKIVAGAAPQPIRVASLVERLHKPSPASAFNVLLSHRHRSPATADIMARLERNWPHQVAAVNAGSSLKFCLIAEGLADFYPRLAPTSEWDTGAAQAVLEAAGGLVVKAPLLGEGFKLDEQPWEPLVYNTGASLLNPFFYALGDPQYDWSSLLQGSL